MSVRGGGATAAATATSSSARATHIAVAAQHRCEVFMIDTAAVIIGYTICDKTSGSEKCSLYSQGYPDMYNNDHIPPEPQSHC